MIVDYHMHLRAPDESIDHTVEAVERYVDVAAERGVDEIGFTEHGYYFEQTRSLWSIPYQLERCKYDLDAYVEAVVEAKDRGLPVKLGLEVDVQLGSELMGETDEILRPYPWDYLIGSIHFVDGLPVDMEPNLVAARGWEEAWQRYFEWLGMAPALNFVDVLAHPDLIRFFGENQPPKRAAADYVDIVEECWANGVSLEVSSAGLRKPLREVYPHPNLLQLAQKSGVSITLASDAHVPQDVARDLDKAIAHARTAGYETVTVFDQRERRQEPLE